MKNNETKGKSDERQRDRETRRGGFLLPEAKQKKDGVDLRQMGEATCRRSESREKLEAMAEN